jgi:hypothetical protein
MKAYGVVDVQIHIFLKSALVGGEWSASRPGSFTPGKEHWRGGWMGPSDSMDNVETKRLLTLPGLEPRPLSRPARSQSLYQLRYRGYLEQHLALTGMKEVGSFRCYISRNLVR